MQKNADAYYQYSNHHPKGQQPLDTVGSVLHSVCAAKGCTWETAYDALLCASVSLGLMPQSKQVVQNMLLNQGFFQQLGLYAKRSIRSIAEACSRELHDGEALILKLPGSSGSYLPLVPSGKGESMQYVLQYPDDLTDLTVSAVWIAWKDGQDHSMKPRRKTTAKAEIRNLSEETPENDALVVFNENPNQNLTGDCAVRAVAGVLEIPWAEAVRRLAAAQDYTATEINSNENIEALLRKEGFQEFDAIRRNGRILNGREFCDIIHDMFQAGTRIFAYAGNSHAVAILVFDENYKIVDTWDSTGVSIIKYWAKYPERPQRRPRQEAADSHLTTLSVGTVIRHNTYGAGTITALNDSLATVLFSDGTEKKLGTAWILKNCKKS